MPTDQTETAFVPVDPDTIAALYARYGIAPIGGGSQEHDDPAADDAGTDDGENDTDLPADLGDKGKEALKKTRQERNDARKRARELESELETLRKAKEDADAAKAQADEEEATRKGEFEKLATERAETIKTVTGERDGYKARLDQALTLLASSVETEWNDTPESVRKLFKGNADDALDKKAFLTEHAELIAELKGKQDATEAKFAAMARTKTPTPDHSGRPETDEKVAKAFQRKYQ